MYLTIDIVEAMINNYTYFEGSSTCFSKNSFKGYKLIEHAYDLLKNNNEYYLSDVISNLRKAINYRVTTLFEQLGIDKIYFNDLGKNRKLEKLEQLDIIKPLLINKLLEIRNGIEYNGKSPPTQRECEELIDIVWYFYRSTDRFCNQEPDALLIEFNDSDNFLRLDFDFHSHKVLKIDGQLPLKYLSEQKIDNAILLHNYVNRDLSKPKINSQSAYFSGEIYVPEIDSYFDIYYIALYEWGNFIL